MKQLDALALFLSGQRIDANIGMVPVETARLRDAWSTLSGTDADASPLPPGSASGR
jgi:hypothetical protein